MKIWHSNCHLCIFTCRFVLLLTKVDWQLVSSRLCEGVQYFQEALVVAYLWPGTWGGGLRHYKSVIPSASGVSAWLHYTGQRLLRTKRGVMGVHATKLQSKGIRQGDSCLLTAEYFSKDQLQLLLLYLSICPLLLFFCFNHRRKTVWNILKSWTSKGKELKIWHIYITRTVSLVNQLSGATEIFSATCQSHIFPKADPQHIRS